MSWSVLIIGCSDDMQTRLSSASSSDLFDFQAAESLDDSGLLNQIQSVDVVLLKRPENGTTAHAISRIGREADVPVIVAADSYDEHDLVEAFKAGAIDYLYPEWTIREVLSRIRAHIRRTHEYTDRRRQGEHYELGSLTIDVARHEVHSNGQAVDLTPKEFELLRMLAANAEKTVTREDLLGEIWEMHGEVNTRTLDVHIGRLRQKVEKSPATPELIITVPGVGYRLRGQD